MIQGFSANIFFAPANRLLARSLRSSIAPERPIVEQLPSNYDLVTDLIDQIPYSELLQEAPSIPPSPSKDTRLI